MLFRSARAAWAAWAAEAARAAWAAWAAEAAWAAGAAERDWQFDRLIAWLSPDEPAPLAIPTKAEKIAA